MVHKIYQKITQGKQEELYEYDPKFSFYEFQLSLGRIALDIISNDDKELLKNPARCVKNFLSEKLYIRTNDQIGKVPLSDMG